MIQLIASYWISAPLAKYISSIIFYQSVSPIISTFIIDMTSVILIQPINYFIVFPILYKLQNSLTFSKNNEYLESKYNLEPTYTRKYINININMDEYEII